MPKVTKDLKDVVGEDKVEEILEKDWKVADLPSEEELSKEEHKSPKARNNPNSRKNLVQYNKRTKEQKEKSLKNLKVTEVQEDVDPKEIFGEKADDEFVKTVTTFASALEDREEQILYYTTINSYLRDFTDDELSFSDMDDIVTLALNKVIEKRLFTTCKTSPKKLLEASAALEKFRKHSDKLKQNLASRRVDRVDTKNKPAMSIVELASTLDANQQSDFEARLEKLKEDKERFSPPERDEEGFLIEE